MFDIMKVARNIKEARIAQNMTQMNLADAMEVSYQAVSNWERGNSMPDIAKLEQLCQILKISIDQLLGAEEAGTVTKIISGDEEAASTVTMEEIGELAPLLPPREVKRLVTVSLEKEKAENGQEEDAPGEKRKGGLDSDVIVGLAPFLGQEDLEELLGQLEEELDLETITGLAPFLSRDCVDALAMRLAGKVEPDELVALAPFLSRDCMDELVTHLSQELEPDEIVCFAPFLSQESVDKLALHFVEKMGLENVICLAPFLSREGLAALVRYCGENGEWEDIVALAPFLGKDTMRELIRGRRQ